MSSLNQVQLIGNVGKDPEIRSTQSGSNVATISIATSESWKDKNSGEKKEKTEMAQGRRLRAAGRQRSGQVCSFKGSRIYIQGQLQTRKWTDKSGVEKYTTEVVIPQYGGKLLLLDSKGERKSSGSASQAIRRARDRPSAHPSGPAQPRLGSCLGLQAV